MIDTIQQTWNWFKKAVPNPQKKNFITQTGVHLEEVHEMLLVITPGDANTQLLLDAASDAVHALANHLKSGHADIRIQEEDRVEFLDSLCDQIVTATGTAHMAYMNPVGALIETNRSNFSKFDESGEPIFAPNGKIMKGSDYTKPELHPFV